MTTSQQPFTVQQIVRKCGQVNLTKHLGIGRDALRKWYSTGIPGRHWMALKRKYPWITYEMLDVANTIIEKRR